MSIKLIESKDSGKIVCDNPNCSYIFDLNSKYNYSAGAKIKIEYFINMPCPLCEQNLLTKEDYIAYQRMTKIINWINKWFSWTMYLAPKNRLNNSITFTAHFHHGVKIKKHKQ